MRFEIVNDEGTVVIYTDYKSCIPSGDQLSSMMKIGFKFRVDGKIVSKKRVEEMRNISSRIE